MDLVENANILDKMTVIARVLFLAQSDESIQNDVKLFYIDIIDQMMPFLNDFLIVEEGTEKPFN